MSNCEKRAEYMMPNIDKFYKLLADKKLWCIYNRIGNNEIRTIDNYKRFGYV
jgi:hypothetical protein